MKTFWIVEKKLDDEISLHYAGSLQVTLDIGDAFKFGTKELAEEFINRAARATDPVFKLFADYSPVEYAELYIKAEDLPYLETQYEG